jgi:L-ascorbate metabolism protein UlaG (beta-lactamase superfamily)
MGVKLTWYGHATWLIETANHKIILDPFLNDSPTAPVKADDIDVDFVLVSHGHSDHVGDAVSIANRTGATVIAVFEIASWFEKQHSVKNTVGMNSGGATKQPFGSVKLTPAIHSSQLPDGSNGGVASGFLLDTDGKNIYFACDTALFSDMQLIGEVGLDAAVLPIGDLFTMGIDDSIIATNFLNPRAVLPQHYNTWPPIQQDADAWAERIRSETKAHPVVLEPGGTFEV